MVYNDKIPIGKYKLVRYSEDGDHYVKIKLKPNVKVKLDDIITLDMIEPYESEAVRKVACHLYRMEYETDDVKFKDEEMKPVLLNLFLEDAREIVKLVHEAEDADE